ncbi:MAG: hypothetical protein ACLVI9_06125 [Anaerostipes hadrus]
MQKVLKDVLSFIDTDTLEERLGEKTPLRMNLSERFPASADSVLLRSIMMLMEIYIMYYTVLKELMLKQEKANFVTCLKQIV